MSILSCSKGKKDESPGPGFVEVNFVTRWDSKPYYAGQIVTSPTNGRWIQFDKLQFYVSNTQIVNSKGESIKLQDVNLLSIIEQPKSGKTSHAEGGWFTAQVPAGNYTMQEFSIGLTQAQNSTSPMQYSATHPLGMNSGMYRFSTNDYIFLILEGKIDNQYGDSRDLPTTPFRYQIALESVIFAPKLSFDVPYYGTRHFTATVNLERLFQDTTAPQNRIYQWELVAEAKTLTDSTARKFRNNFAKAVTFSYD